MRNPSPSLYNPDLAPVPLERRTWTRWHIAALWVGMTICITTYTLAAGLLAQGMNWWQALLAVLLGNVIVLIPMTLNAHPGTEYGIPFPVVLRASFGTLGANIPAMARALVSCGWLGIQTWIGGSAIYATGAVLFGWNVQNDLPIPGWGISAGQLGCFLFFWCINVYFIWRGMNSIRWLETWSAPFLLLVGIGLLFWAVTAAKGWGPIFSQPDQFESRAEFWQVFGAGVTAMVGYWATLSLNIPDFSRYAGSQRDQIYGQALGLPVTMVLYSFIGIAVTSATVVVFGEALWDPVQLVAKFRDPLWSVLALVALSVATLSTNIAANVVSPANDFSNLAPRWISFRAGGVLAAVIGVAIRPWDLYGDPGGYIFKWLIGYSALLGPIAGIMIADYHWVRRRKLDVEDLYRTHGQYRFVGGFSLVGITSLLAGVAPNVPGFLLAIGTISPGHVPPICEISYNYAWFTGFGISFLLYPFLRRIWPWA